MWIYLFLLPSQRSSNLSGIGGLIFPANFYLDYVQLIPYTMAKSSKPKEDQGSVGLLLANYCGNGNIFSASHTLYCMRCFLILIAIVDIRHHSREPVLTWGFLLLHTLFSSLLSYFHFVHLVSRQKYDH